LLGRHQGQHQRLTGLVTQRRLASQAFTVAEKYRVAALAVIGTTRQRRQMDLNMGLDFGE
jgi:hypothetical protein